MESHINLIESDSTFKTESLCRLTEIRNTVAKYENPSDIPKALHAQMRDAYSIVFLPGAIRIPFVYGGENEKGGEIILSFSGFPTGEQDLWVVDIVRHMIRRYVIAMEGVTLMDGSLNGRSEIMRIEAATKLLAKWLR